MIDRQEPRYQQAVQPLSFPTARQSPVHLPRIEMRIWLYLSSRIGQIITGEELLDFAWEGKDRQDRKLDWNHPDPVIRKNHRHLVSGAIEHIRGRVHADGQYIIDTTYAKADGLEGYRVRETTDEDAVALMKQGYLGAYNRRMAMLAEREALAAEARRPALEAPREPSPASNETDAAPVERPLDQWFEANRQRLDLPAAGLDHQDTVLKPQAHASGEPGLEVAGSHVAAELVEGG